MSDLKMIHNSYCLNDKAKEIDIINDIIYQVKYNSTTITSIAAKYNVSVPTIYKILNDNKEE